ncbi:MAG: mandelate racemase/muconate lactonizing enzyme family protein [bacterium]|nr:mandelate racemase/muconate lactonizing enzyme family protein [bacterium]
MILLIYGTQSGRFMKITGITVHTIANSWKDWLWVRVATDEGISGVGEGTVNAFSGTVETAIRELEERVKGHDPFDIEALLVTTQRDVYTDGGQIHGAAVAAIEMACWDIVGKALDTPVHRLLGGQLRDRVRAYANGWYTVDRTPEEFAGAARRVIERGFTAMKFDPFGDSWQVQSGYEEDLSVALVEAVREEVGTAVDLMVEAHGRFGTSAAVRIAERLAPFRPAWFEEPVSHHNIPLLTEVARRSPVPIAAGESFSSLQQFAELLATGAVGIVQPEPVHLGGLWRARQVASLADACRAVVAPHNAQGPICSAVSAQLGACVPNFYVQESFDSFNEAWTRDLVDPPIAVVDGWIEVPTGPGLGIEVDWDRAASHADSGRRSLELFSPGWELRGAEPPPESRGADESSSVSAGRRRPVVTGSSRPDDER